MGTVLPELRAQWAQLQEALRDSRQDLEGDLDEGTLPPDLKKRIQMALLLVRGLKDEQGKAERFVSESGDMLAKEVGSDVKGFEEFAMRLETVKARLDYVKEPLRIARIAVDELATNYADLSFIYGRSSYNPGVARVRV